MKKSLALRTQITLLMALLVFLQSLALVLSLIISGVFFELDAESFRLFNSTANARMQEFNGTIGNLVAGVAGETNELASVINQLADENGVDEQDIYRNDMLYADVALRSSAILLRVIRNYDITGAFVMLNGSNSNKTLTNAHSAVYIRDTAPGGPPDEGRHYQLLVGPIAISQQLKIPTAMRWNLDLQFGEDTNTDYFAKPIWAAGEYPNAETERYGFWQQPADVLGDGQKVVTYTMPLIGGNGKAYGVLGIEILLPFFAQNYLPNADLPYSNSFYAITEMQNSQLPMNWVIPSGPLADVYLVQGRGVNLAAAPNENLYQTNIEGFGDMYCSLHTLQMYSANSPFYDYNWSLAGFVPYKVLHETSQAVRFNLIASIIAVSVVAVFCVFLLAYISTRKISRLSKFVGTLSPLEEVRLMRTGLREIDELSSAVEMLNKSVITASKTTAKVLEMTLLPIGGFEVTSEAENVILTEFIYKILHKETGEFVSKDEWNEIYEKLISQPAEGYENIYRYIDKNTNDNHWLRVVKTDTDTGYVGVILDVTKDVEEHRRLAHELDYDALTHLLNRTAFKREANMKMREAPNKVGAMLFADLDNLKYINDNFGHDMGDRLIIKAGEMFREFAAYGGIVSRISGDEFAIFVHGFDTKEQVLDFVRAQYRRNENYSLKTNDGHLHRIRYSSGIALYPQDSDNVTDLLKLADFAMYEAKHTQKGNIFEFDAESYKQNAYLLENREAINRLLDEGLIRFAFQPIVDLRTGRIYAYEALMRPLLDNFKSPMQVITVAEAQSKLGQLERLVQFVALQTVLENIKDLGDAQIFINSIPTQILSDEDIMLLRKSYESVMNRVVIEITEEENNSPQKLKFKVDKVRELGFKLAIDDFGSGYSNELRILSISPEIVKIDMGMIQGIADNHDKQRLVKNIVSFCHLKDIRVVAEGVEDIGDLEEIIRLDVDYVQGYYTGKPQFEFANISEDMKKEIVLLNKERGMHMTNE